MKKWERDLLGGVSTDKGWSLVEAFSRQMRCMPEEVKKGADILVQALKEIGIEPVVHTPEIYLGIPVSASVKLGNFVIQAKASALSPSVNNLTAPLVHLKAKPSTQGVHLGDPQSLFETHFSSQQAAMSAVKGRIVITEGLSNPARTKLLQSWGAAAVIVINPGDRSHWGTNSTIWGSPVGDEIDLLPTIASVAVSRLEGDQLLAEASVIKRVTLNVEALSGWFEQPVVTAEVLGEGPEASDFILLHSHYDSWEYGVGDNATGNAVLLEVARLFSQQLKPFRRSVRFAWWPGHSAGRYAGSAWYAKEFADDLEQNCIAHINCDSPGCKNATSYVSIRSMAEAEPLLKRSVRDLFGQSCMVMRPGRAGDYSFNNLGITGTMLTSSIVPKEERDRRGWYAVGGCGGSPAWHSEYDTIEVADRDVLENDIKLYALVTARMANEGRVPLDYQNTLQQMLNHLKNLKYPFRNSLQTTETIKELLMIANLAKSTTGSDLVLNSMFKQFSRAVVRLNYVVKESRLQDPAQMTHPVPLITQSSNAAEAEQNFLAVKKLLEQMKAALAPIS